MQGRRTSGSGGRSRQEHPSICPGLGWLQPGRWAAVSLMETQVGATGCQRELRRSARPILERQEMRMATELEPTPEQLEQLAQIPEDQPVAMCSTPISPRSQP